MDLAVLAPIQRSGSTLAQRICNSRPKTLVWGENGGAITNFRLIWEQGVKFSEYSDPERKAFFGAGHDANTWIANLTPEMPYVERAIVATVRGYFDTLYSQYRDQHDLVGFKEVRYGKPEFEVLRKCYPQMKFIMLIRNPLDCWNSCSTFEWFRSPNEFAMLWNMRARGILPFLKTCPNAHLVRYEELVGRSSKAMQVFRDVAQVTDEQMESVLKVKLNSTPQGLSPADVAVITEICGATMEELGYDVAQWQPTSVHLPKTIEVDPQALKDAARVRLRVEGEEAVADNGWRNHFAKICEIDKGRTQTPEIMRQFVHNIPERERAYLASKDLRILEWGCSLGEGVEVLGAEFPSAHVAGLDFSEHARAKARAANPTREFIVNQGGDISGKWDVIVNSNCLEFFDDPIDLLRSHLPSCLSLYLAMIPHREHPFTNGHRSQFREELFPAEMDGFTRLFSNVVPIERGAQTVDHMVVAYASSSYLERIGVTSELLAAQRQSKTETVSATHLADKLSRQLDEIDSSLALVAGNAGAAMNAAVDRVDARVTDAVENIAERIDGTLGAAADRLAQALDQVAARETQLEAQRRMLLTELRREEERFTQSQIELRAKLSERDSAARRLEEELREETEQSLELRRVLKAKVQETAQAERHAAACEEQVAALRQELAKAEQAVQAQVQEREVCFRRDVDVLARHSNVLAEHLNYAERRLVEIQNCQGWRMLKVLWWVRLKLMPRHSYRERAAHFCLRTARRAVGRAPIPVLPATPATPVQPALPALAAVSTAPACSPGAVANATAIPPHLAIVDGRLPRTELSDEQSRTVLLLATTFFNFDGADMFCGGAERYLVELGRIIRSLGYRPIVYQCARDKDWTRWYNDLEVRGLAADCNMDKLAERFHREIPATALTIYSPFNLAWEYAHARSLSISHGVWWDHPSFQFPENVDLWRARIIQSIRNCERLVSVDTNTINFVRATDHASSSKLSYIPNFVDTDVFYPHPRSGDRVVVLYPRRLYGPRGFWLLADLAPKLLKKYPQVDIHFVGKADAKETQAVETLVAQFPGRIAWRHYEPDDMHQAYANADIALIPTVNSEGTSLSCLEAMASGNAVIATNVGGLPDLVFDGHNGLLIEPTSDRLWGALVKLLDDPELRARLGRNAREVALRFSQEVWVERWRETLQEQLPVRMETASIQNAWTVVHPRTPGIDFHTRKQRPQQLLQAIAEQGHHAFFVNDAPVPPELADMEDRIPHLHIVPSNDSIQLTRPVVYVYYAYEYRNLKRWPNPIVIYDVLDAPEIHAESDRIACQAADDNFVYYHKKLLAEAEIILTSSEELFERYRKVRPDMLLVPNATRPEDFAAPWRSRPEDLPPVGTKIVGYYGAIAEWFDFKLMSQVASARPEYNFVLMGVTNQQEKLQELLSRNPNVYYLGEKKYEELASYLAHFDATTIPFVVNSVTHAVSPVKLFEYMAGGKPTVSTDLYECRKYDTVLLARSAQEFAQQLDKATRLVNDADFVERLRATAAENAWSERAKVVLSALEQRADVHSAGESPAPTLRKCA